MSNKLKPCPWPSCGSDDVDVVTQVIDEKEEYSAVFCWKCGAEGPNAQTKNYINHKEEAARLWNERAGDENKSELESKNGLFISQDRSCFILVQDDAEHRYSWDDLPEDVSTWDSDDYLLQNLLLAHGIKKGMNDVDQPEIEYFTISADGSKIFVVENGEVKEYSLGEDYRKLFGEEGATDANGHE